jgi:hypothetical protein
MSADRNTPDVTSAERLLGQVGHAIKCSHIDLPSQTIAVERAHALVDRSPLKPAQILVIEAAAALGKTRVLDVISGHVRSEYVPPVPGRTLRVTCEGPTDGNALGILLCRELETAPIGLGNMPRLTYFVCKRMEQRLKTEACAPLAIDNAHLFLQGGVVNEKALELLGGIIASGLLPIILCGRSGTLTVGNHLIAMVGQLIEVTELSPISYTKGADLTQIGDFLTVLTGDVSPLLDKLGITINLNTDEWRKRFWGGSWGSPGTIKELVLETLLAVGRRRFNTKDTSRYSVKREDFAETWRLLFARTSPLKFNPFKRDDAPTLGEIQDARTTLEQDGQKKEFQLPRAPKGKGSIIWR